METSPPVRDVSERHRANRNKCIVVAVTSAVILAAVVIIITYIVHFSSTELTPSSANAVIDKSLLSIRNDSVPICNSAYEIILKENDTSLLLLERHGDCTEAPQTREDLEKRNDTNDEPRPNVICKLSASNVRLASLSGGSRAITKDCKFNITIEVDFAFNEDNKVESIVFREADKSKAEITVGIVGQVRDLLEESILRFASDYSAGNTTIDKIEPNWDSICRGAPWGC